MKQRKGLGRGLGALLPEKEVEEDLPVQEESTASLEILIDKIEVNPFQPRTHFDQEALQELSDSIRVQGIIQPITVRALANGNFQLISGERRFQASKLAGLKAIPAYIMVADDQQVLEMALIENIQRENLNAIEVALAYQRLMNECGLKLEELGTRVGKNRSTVNNYLRLLKLPKELIDGLREQKLSMGHARALLSVEDHKMLKKLYEKIISEQWSVRKVEDAVRGLTEETKKETTVKSTVDKTDFSAFQNRLASWFQKKVKIKAAAEGKGEIQIPFSSKEELEAIIDKLKRD